MYTILVTLVVIASILMCLIVLVQESKGGGLASGFASGNQVMGVRKTTDVIEKFTWGLAIAMVVFSVASVYSLSDNTESESVVNTAAMEQPASTSATNIPGMDAASQPASGQTETPAAKE